MAKRIIASGETERRALPHLLRHLGDEGITLDSVRTPPRHGKLTPDITRKLVVSAWWEKKWTLPPNKFVILDDADGKEPREVIGRLEGEMSKLGEELGVPIRVAVAQWHLEAWFFADPAALREYVGGKSLGSVDPTRPDEILNPKHCLKQLLEETYTSRLSEEIARRLSAEQVRARSPSFAAFEQAVRNGPAAG